MCEGWYDEWRGDRFIMSEECEKQDICSLLDNRRNSSVRLSLKSEGQIKVPILKTASQINLIKDVGYIIMVK